MLQLLQLNLMLSWALLKSLLRNRERKQVPTGRTAMKLNRTNKTTLIVTPLLRLHDAIQNPQLICFVHETPAGQGGFHRTVKKLPSLQALTWPSCRTWGRLQLYQLPEALQKREGTTKPAVGLGQNKATPDSGHPPPQLCNTKSAWLFTQQLWAKSRSQIRHVQLLLQTSLPVRQSAGAYPNSDCGFQLMHTQPQHSTWETLLGLKKTHTSIECL